jgi:hypothetical protein
MSVSRRRILARTLAGSAALGPGRAKAPAATPRTLDFELQKLTQRRERERESVRKQPVPATAN